MIFEFNEQQKMLQKMVREFAEQEIAPGVMERDEKEEFSRELLDKAGDLGLTGICFPEAYGGSDGDYISYIIASEEIARVDDCVATGFSASVSLCAFPIYNYGTEAQKQKYLMPLATGQKLGQPIWFYLFVFPLAVQLSFNTVLAGGKSKNVGFMISLVYH